MTIEEYSQNGVWYLLGATSYLCFFIFTFQSYYFLMEKYGKKPVIFPTRIDVKSLYELAFTSEYPEANFSARMIVGGFLVHAILVLYLVMK